MATATAQERYFEGLMDRVREDRYPSHQLLDRIEASFWTSQQVIEYVDMLLEKMDDSWYPSKQILARIQRLLAYTAAATR
jgi:aspartyl-tRNA synthetase